LKLGTASLALYPPTLAAPNNRQGRAPMAERKGRAERGRSAAQDASKSVRLGRVCCAIYTRKSSEEGLEQEFNSLDAQREACEAYVRSQKHEGWLALPTLYDDPGYSGGNMERPALKRLLADIAAKRIDVVVVYKVDRLTRSLADFAKMVEVFDASNVSFVSITQAFNTTTSMGRLTLNVLLPFAQFEREVTGERIRDKIAASKKKGLWMGGQPALGYDVKDRKLVVNEAEAEAVRAIFRRDLALGSVRELKAMLDAEGAVSEHRIAANGSSYGGQAFSRGSLYQMLQNRVYCGEIVHKGAAYPGEHPAIVDVELWRQVQEKLEANGVERTGARDRAKLACLLAGVLFDAEGGAMTPTHAVKKGARYRYYVSRRLITDVKASGQLDPGRRDSGQRLPSGDLERLVIDRIRTFFADANAVTQALPPRRHNAPSIKRALGAAADFVRGIAAEDADKTFEFLRPLIARAQVHPDRIDIELAADRVTDVLLGGEGATEDHLGARSDADTASFADDDRGVAFAIEAQLQRAGMEMRFVIDGVEIGAPPDDALIRLLARAHSLARRLATNTSVTLEEAGSAEGMGAPYAARLMRLNFLAPDIVVAILNGRQPAALTATKLMADTRLPLRWTEQRKALGFA
jgi:site-specific DNA recombinase